MGSMCPRKVKSVSCVSITKCPDYDRERVGAAVRECLARLDGLDSLLRGKKVML